MRILLPVLLLSACTTELGSGIAASETRSVEASPGLDIGGPFEVEVQTGADAATVILTCDDNLLPLIVTEVRSNALYIGPDEGRSVQPATTCSAVVSVPTLTRVSVAGSANVRFIDDGRLPLAGIDVLGSGGVDVARVGGCDTTLNVSGSGSISIADLEACGVEAGLSGSGRIEVAGAVERVSVDVSGSGSFLGATLRASVADIAVSGSGQVHAYASETAEVRISGSGDVHLYGGTTVRDPAITGSGRLIIE